MIMTMKERMRTAARALSGLDHDRGRNSVEIGWFQGLATLLQYCCSDVRSALDKKDLCNMVGFRVIVVVVPAVSH